MSLRPLSPSFLFSLRALPLWCFFFVFFVYVSRDLAVYYGLLSDDADNYLHGAQLLDFIRHGNWQNTLLSRFDPPGVDIYARLADIPYFLTAKPLIWFGIDDVMAVFLSSLLTQLFLLVPLYLFLSWWMVKPLVQEKWAFFAPIAAIFASDTLMAFTPGTLDHHGLQILLTMAACGFLARQWVSTVSAPYRNGTAIALSFALSLAIGVETLPFVVFILCVMGLQLLWEPSNSNKTFYSSVAVALPAFTFLFLVLLREPQSYFDNVLYRLSWLHVAGTVLAGLSLILLLVLDKQPKFIRAALCAALVGGGFYLISRTAPELLAKGIWAGIDPASREYSRLYTFELKSGRDIHPLLFLFFTSGITALAGYLMHAKKSSGGFWFALTMGGLTLAVTFGSYFYAFRIKNFCAPFFIPGILIAVSEVFARLKKLPYNRRRFCLEAVTLSLLFPLTGPLLVNAIYNQGVIDTIVFFAPQERGTEDLKTISNYLTTEGRGDQPQNILVSTEKVGAELVLRTPHIVIGSAQGYTHVQGHNINLAFYSATSDQQAAHILTANKIDYVLFSNKTAALYRRLLVNSGFSSADDASTMLSLLQQNREPSFLSFCAGGKDATLFKVDHVKIRELLAHTEKHHLSP